MGNLLGGEVEENRRGIVGVTGAPVTPGSPAQPAPPTDGPVDPGSGNIAPVSSVDLWKSYGVQGNPTRGDQPYAANLTNIDDWVTKYANTGVAYVRMKFTAKSAGADLAISRLRAAGMKAICPVTQEAGDRPTSSTEAEIRATVRAIAATAGDVVIAIEGVNEPNHNRGTLPGGGTPAVPGDWARTTVNVQRYIAEEVAASAALSRVYRVGTSLHDNAASGSYSARDTLATRAGLTKAQMRPKGFVATQAALPTTGRTAGDTWYIDDGTQRNFTWTGSAWTAPLVYMGGIMHFHQVVNEGILDYIDVNGQHTYPGPGDTPLGGRDGGWPGRVHTCWDAYGDGFPIWNTEWGYTTPPKTTSGHATAMPAAAATYGPRALLEFWKGYGLRATASKVWVCRFEGVDDPDPTGALAEAWFGMWGVPSTTAGANDPANWKPKPEVAKMSAILNFLKPSNGWAATYTPPRMDLSVNLGTSTDVRWAVVGKPDGSCWLFYWRNQMVQANSVGTPKALLTVQPVSFSYTDSVGKHTVTNCDGEVRWVEVFR